MGKEKGWTEQVQRGRCVVFHSGSATGVICKFWSFVIVAAFQLAFRSLTHPRIFLHNLHPPHRPPRQRRSHCHFTALHVHRQLQLDTHTQCKKPISHPRSPARNESYIPISFRSQADGMMMRKFFAHLLSICFPFHRPQR